MSGALLQERFGSGSWTRTSIDRVRADLPAIRRSPNESGGSRTHAARCKRPACHHNTSDPRVGPVGFEPTRLELKARCSTAELRPRTQKCAAVSTWSPFARSWWVPTESNGMPEGAPVTAGCGTIPRSEPRNVEGRQSFSRRPSRSHPVSRQPPQSLPRWIRLAESTHVGSTLWAGFGAYVGSAEVVTLRPLAPVATLVKQQNVCACAGAAARASRPPSPTRKSRARAG